MEKQFINPDTIFTPVPAVLVTCGDRENSNIISIAWTGILNSIPPMVYISVRKERFSYDLIKNTGEFAINLPEKNLVREVDFCGTKSGKNVDKFQETGLTKEQPKQINVPLILECPINIECKVKEIKNLGSHNVFMAEIASINVKKDLITQAREN